MTRQPSRLPPTFLSVALRQDDLFVAEARRFLDDLLCVLHRTQIAGQSDLSHRKRPPMCGNIFKRGIDRQRRRKIRTRSLRTHTADHIDIDILIRQRDTDDLFEYRKEHVQTCIIHADCGPTREADI